MVLVDNSVYSFAYQLDNGIPIITWYDDPYDNELQKITDYIKSLADVSDVRDRNREKFRLRTFYQDYIKAQEGKPIVH